MSEPQPPAGWYADPQDARQQRYWDGSTWTGHTAPAASTMSAPTGIAPTGAALPTGAPAWTMQAGGEPVAAKRSWYKRKAFLIPAAIVIVLIIIGSIGAAVSGGDHSSAIERAIKSNGQEQLQTAVSRTYPGAVLKLTDVSCVETGTSQEYNCLLHATITYQGQTQRFLQDATGSCDSNDHCLWHTTDTLHPDNS
jgi:Protein of unknown function (DUF2510)